MWVLLCIGRACTLAVPESHELAQEVARIHSIANAFTGDLDCFERGLVWCVVCGVGGWCFSFGALFAASTCPLESVFYILPHILTSNIGSASILEAMETDPATVKERVTDQVRVHFRPEFINRVDEFIIFQGLQKSQIRSIVDLQVAKVQDRLDAKKMTLVVEPSAIDHLAERGYDPAFGARPVKRVVQQELETALAKAILRGDVGDGDTVTVRGEEDRLVVSRSDGRDILEQADNPAELTL